MSHRPQMRDIHNTFSFGETHDGKCSTCGMRTVLVSFYGDASVDQEPFENGQFAKDSPEAKAGLEIPDSVTVDDEISGHFCLQCNVLTSLSFNACRRQP